MLSRPHPRVTAILMALVVVTGVVACGDDDDDDAETTAGDTQSSTTPTTATTRPASTAETTVSPSTSTDPTDDSTVPPTTDPSCGRYGPLVTYEINDRCEPASDTLGPTFAVNAEWNGLGTCLDMVAVPNQLIVAVDPTSSDTSSDPGSIRPSISCDTTMT